MTQKELKKLRRADLLEMLLTQSRENEELRRQVSELQEQQKQREIIKDNAGSIAEAALQLNGVFGAAQDACTQYIESIEKLNIRQKKMSEELEQETAAKCQQMEQESRERCDKMLVEARQQADSYWNEISGKLKEFVDAHAVLQTLFANPPGKTNNN